MERVVYESDGLAGCGCLHPVWREVCGNGGWSVKRNFDFAEARVEGGHFLGKAQAAGVEIREMSGEAFDFGEVVRRKKNRGFPGAFEKGVAKFVANHGIKAAEWLIEDDELGAKRESAGESGFHAHAAGKMFEFAIQGKSNF